MHKFLSWRAVILWMALIFNLSSQVAEQSNELSTGITEVIVKTVEKVAPQAEFNIKSFNNVLRKNAHFFAYLVLGILVLTALKHEYVYCTNIGLAGSDKIFFSQIPIDKAQGVMR